MQYRNAPTPKEIRRADAYSRFLVLYRDYPALIAPPPPDSEGGQADSMSLMPGNLIDRLHFSVMNSEYVGLLDNVKLGKLFTDLEKMRSNESSSPLDPKLRELKFLYRYAQLIQRKGTVLEAPNPAKSKVARKKLVKACETLEKLLIAQMADEALINSLKMSDLYMCKDLKYKLPLVAQALRTVNPVYPYERLRGQDKSAMVWMIHGFANCCFRIYLGCNEKIIKQMLKPDWIFEYGIFTDNDIKKMIQNALDQKINEYENRMSGSSWPADPDAHQIWDVVTHLPWKISLDVPNTD